MLIAVFMVVGSGVVYELLIAATSAHLWGDSIYQFSLTIGLFMSAMGVGSYLSQKLEGPLVDALSAVWCILALAGGATFFVLRVADLYTASYLIVAYIWTALLGSLVGISLPLAMRIIEAHRSVKDLLAQVLFVDYLGALVGSLALPWFLLPRFGFAKTSVAVAGVCLLGCILLLIGFGRDSDYLGRRVLWMPTIGVLLLLGWFGSEPLLHDMVNRYYKGIKEVYVMRSPYQEIRFVEYKKSQFLFLNRQPQFSSQDERRYHEALVHPPMSLAPSRKRVLILGGGDGLAMREIWKYHDVEEVVMVDLDKAMTRFGKEHPTMAKMNQRSMKSSLQTRWYCLYEARCIGRKGSKLLWQQQQPLPTQACPAWAPQAPMAKGCTLHTRKVKRVQKFHIFNRDAWKYMEQTPKSFSVIISDLPDATNISLSKLYSIEFYRLMRRRLAPQGMISIQSTSVMPGYRRAYWCIVHTIGASGLKTRGYHAWVPSFGVHTTFTLASHKPITPQSIRWRVPTTFLNQEMVSSLFWFPKDIQEVKTRVNRIDTHILLRYLLKGR